MAGQPPRVRPPTTPAACSPHRACRPRDSVGPPQPHTRTHNTCVAYPNSPPSGRAVGGGTAPDLKRPSQWWKAPPPVMPFRYPHSEQRRPARAHAVGPVLGPHARTDRTRDTRDAEPWLPASEDGRPGEGQRLTASAPHNGGRPPPPGDGPPPPPRRAAPTGHAGQGDSVGPPHPHTRAHSTWVADHNSPPNGRAVGRGTAPDLRRPSQWWKAPPPGTPFRHPHSEQRRPAKAHAVGPVLGPHARNDRARDTRVAEPWLHAPEDGRPGEGQRLTPSAPHNGGRPAARGRPPTTPAACSPHRACRPRGQCWAPTPTHLRPQHVGGGPQQPAQWAGSRGRDGAWPQTSPTMVEGTPPRGRPSATPTASNAGPQGRTLWGWCRVPTPASTASGTHGSRNPGCPLQRTGGRGRDTRRPSQRWQATPHGDGPQPPPGHAAPTEHAGQGDSVGPPQPHTRAHSTWGADPNSPSSGRAVGGGTAPDLRRPPPGTPSCHPHSEPQRARTDRTRDTLVAEPWLPAPEDGRPGEGQRLTPGAPHNGGRPTPPGTAPHHPRGTQSPQGVQAKGTLFRQPHSEQRQPAGAHAVGPVLGPHARTDRTWDTWVTEPWLPAPEDRRPGEGQRLTPGAPLGGGRPPPPGTAPRHPAACSPHRACRPRGQCWAPTPTHPRPQHVGGRPQQPAPVGGQSGEGQRLASDAPHNDGRHPPGNALPPPPQQATPARRGARCGAGAGSPRPHRPHPGHRVAERWLSTPKGGGPGEGQRLTPGAPHNGGRHPPGGRPSATPTASNAGPQGRTLWDRCWVPTPAMTAPGTHGSRNPGCQLQRTSGRGRDSA